MEAAIKEASDFESLIERELRFFPTNAMKAAFRELLVTPYEMIERWGYSKELHRCWVVAEKSEHRIVYCETGFGPHFPWSTQPKRVTDLSTDGEWCAYLFEAFMSPFMWIGEPPSDFMLMGPGERG